MDRRYRTAKEFCAVLRKRPLFLRGEDFQRPARYAASEKRNSVSVPAGGESVPLSRFRGRSYARDNAGYAIPPPCGGSTRIERRHVVRSRYYVFCREAQGPTYRWGESACSRNRRGENPCHGKNLAHCPRGLASFR